MKTCLDVLLDALDDSWATRIPFTVEFLEPKILRMPRVIVTWKPPAGSTCQSRYELYPGEAVSLSYSFQFSFDDNEAGEDKRTIGTIDFEDNGKSVSVRVADEKGKLGPIIVQYPGQSEAYVAPGIEYVIDERRIRER